MEPKMKIAFYIKKYACDLEGYCPVMGAITVGPSRVCFTTRIKAPMSLWVSGLGRVGGGTKEAGKINDQLDELIGRAHRHYHRLSERFDRVTARQVKEAVLGMASSVGLLLQVFSAHNEEFRKRIGVSRTANSMKNYNLAYQRLAEFIKKRYRLDDVPFTMLDMTFIDRYDAYLRYDLRLQSGTILTHINPLRKMIKIAIGRRFLDCDPFALYKPKRVKYEPRYLSKLDFDKLVNTHLDDINLRLVRDMFLLASFTGIAYIDMYNLTQQNLVRSPDGKTWLVFKRQKSGNDTNIPLMPIALEIIERYRGVPRGDKLLPMYCSARTNELLKIIGKQCGIEMKLTFHCARHTFATQHTLSRGVPIESVSHMMGHGSIRSTQMYAEVTSEKIHREMKACKERINESYTLSNLED